MKEKVNMYKHFDEEYGVKFSMKEQKRQMKMMEKAEVGVLLNRKLMVNL